MKTLVTLKWINNPHSVSAGEKDTKIFMPLKGKCALEIAGKTYHLLKDDFILANDGEECVLQEIDGLTAIIIIDRDMLLDLLHYQPRYFVCSSSDSQSDAIQTLRKTLNHLLTAPYQPDFDSVSLQKYGYDLIMQLLVDFSNNDYWNNHQMQEKEKIAAYMHANFSSSLGLADAAEHFGFSEQYFSRYFKKTFGISFLKYLNSIRLDNAEKELVESDESILKIALQSGFPNVASFNRVFREKHQMTPVEYRQKHQMLQRQSVLSDAEARSILLDTDSARSVSPSEIEVDVRQNGQLLNKYWTLLCNLGGLSRIADLRIQNQIRHLQQDMNYQYARVFLDRMDWDASVDFYDEDNAMEFLLDTGLKPVFAIDFRASNKDSFFEYLHKLIQHQRTRFGMRKYVVEVVYDSDFSGDKAIQYSTFQHHLRSLAREDQFELVLCGPGLLLNEGGVNLKTFLEENDDLDMITIMCAPFTVGSRDGKVFINRITQSDYIIEQYRLADRIAAEHNSDAKLLITSWRDTLDEYDVLNDSSWSASRIVQAVLKGYGVLPSLPMERPLDILADGTKENKIFNGLAGLMTADGIEKPAYYGFRFLNHLDHTFLWGDEHVIVTSSGTQYFEIVAQNTSLLSYRYYLDRGDLLPGKEIPMDIFEEYEDQTFNIVLKGVPDGKYFVKKRIVNDEVRNAFRKWLDLNYEDSSYLGKDEYRMLQGAEVPMMRGEDLVCVNGVLRIPILLNPNEVCQLHILPKYQK